jgi:uncharacterized repeat protein (TIGR01451 family)
VRDAGESGIPNITVTLSGACGGSCPSTTTDVDGYYSFTNLLDGSYTVTVDQADLDFPAGLTQTYDPDSSVDNQTTVVIAGGVVTSIGGSACSNCSLNADFGYRFDGVSSLSGTICLDDATPNGVCGSGISDVSAGELAFANVTVYLYRWIDTGDNIPQPGEVVLVGSTPSGGTGDYSFTQLAVGAYLVSIGSPLENTQLTTVTGNTPATAVVKAPGSGATTSAYQSVVLPGSAVNGLDFAFKSLVNYDFGDLPASYSTTLESNPDGARHVVLGTPTLYLGTRPDSESNGQPSALADGDGADEDGVTLVNPNAWTNGLASAKGGKVQVNVTGSGWLVGWLDFNGDGDFTDSSEMIISQPVSTGTAIYPFNIPNGTLTGTGKVVNGRFRLFDQQPAFPIFAYAGTASSGEVEDYRFLLSTGIVDGTIYSDTNTDGVYTLGIDVPLPSVIVVVTDSLGGVYTLTTDSNGYFSQTVPAGSTVVDVRDSTLPAGSTLTPGNTDPTTLIVPVGETATDNTGYVAPAAPDLRIVKTDGGVSTIPGGTVAYTLSYTNTGNVGATRVVITETVPANTSFSVSGSTAGWNCTLNGIAGSTCTWSVGSLASGASGSITFEVTVVNPVPAGVTQVANTAVIADDGTNGNDPTPANNTSSDVTPITAVPILKAQKSVVNLEGHVTVAGDRLEYTIVIQNTGNTAATGTALMDAIPANTTYLPGSTKLNGASIADLGSTMPYASGGQVDSPGEPSGQINAGESATIVFRVKIDDPLPAGVTQISNQGIVSATGIASLSTNNPSTLAPDDPTTLSISKPTAIALANFTATWQDNAVDLRWETTAELNTWGFQLYRSTDGKRASAVRVTPVLILGQGRGQGGASYIWIDTTAQVGVTYVYWLVETELNGTTNEYGPTRALPRTESSASRVLLPMMLR